MKLIGSFPARNRSVSTLIVICHPVAVPGTAGTGRTIAGAGIRDHSNGQPTPKGGMGTFVRRDGCSERWVSGGNQDRRRRTRSRVDAIGQTSLDVTRDQEVRERSHDASRRWVFGSACRDGMFFACRFVGPGAEPTAFDLYALADWNRASSAR